MKLLRAQLLMLVLAVTSCTTVLLVLRCSSRIDEISVHSVSQNHPELKHDTDTRERHAMARHAASKQLSDQSHALQWLQREAGILDADENSKNSMSSVDILRAEHPKYVNLSREFKRHFTDTVSLLVKPVSYNNEFEMVPFTRFTLDRLYPVDPGLGRRVIEKPIGFRKREILSVIEHAANRLQQTSGRTFSVSDFLEGIYRAVPSIGTHYELYFRDRKQYRKVIVALPNTVPFSVREEAIEVQKETVHIVLALSQRASIFQLFLQRFKDLLREDNNIDLTVIYFGHASLDKVQSLVKEFNSHYNSERIHLLTTYGKFSRGQGLQIAVDSLANSSLVFLCDVDIVLTPNFLERCRLHASLRHSVYYPIVFSLYNPAVLSQLQPTASVADKPTISRDTGFWRDFGYGMTCQYRADFLSIGGFQDEDTGDESSAGWGLEDVRLYRKHLQAGRLTVVRATDPGIFHIWHEKTCPHSLTEDQYQGCLRSRALSEASQAQLGMLLLQNNLVPGRTV